VFDLDKSSLQPPDLQRITHMVCVELELEEKEKNLSGSRHHKVITLKNPQVEFTLMPCGMYPKREVFV